MAHVPGKIYDMTVTDFSGYWLVIEPLFIHAFDIAAHMYDE